MKKFKLKSFCKINLLLRVITKLKSGYHSLLTLVTFCDLHDVIIITEINSAKDRIIFYGKYKKNINLSSNTAINVLQELRNRNYLKKKRFKINIKKNIPHGSGLGGGSSNAATLLNFFKSKMNLKISKRKLIDIANKIGSDVPITLQKKNTILTGGENKILRINNKFNLWILIVYPNIHCSTKEIFKKNKKFSSNIYISKSLTKNKLIVFLKNESNDLEKIVTKLHPKIGDLISFIKIQNGCHFSRITGSGSACIGIFSDMNSTICAQKMIKFKFPKYWSAVSKSI